MQAIVTSLALGGQEALKGKAIGGQTGRAQGGDGGTGTGQRHHLDPGFTTAGDQVITGVADERGTGIGDQRNTLALFDPADQHIGFLLLVVIVQGEGRHRDLVVAEQDTGMTGIFGCHQIDTA